MANGKRKTTVYLDPDVLRATKVLAARTDRRDSEVVEAALRRYTGLEAFESARARSDLTEEEAMELANTELHALRRGE